jgi:hypothetical protein
MWIARPAGIACLAALGFVTALVTASPAAMAKTVRPPATYAGRVKLFLNPTDTPVLFVGKVEWVNPNYLACTIQNTRSTTWSVSRVLYGFDPGKKIDVGFGSCGLPEAQFTSQNEMLVIAYPGYRNLWVGMKESVVPATDANIQAARQALDAYLRGKIRELVQPQRNAPTRPILVFEGILIDIGPDRDRNMPCPSSVPPVFQLKFGVEHILRGIWEEKQITIGFSGCGPLPTPPYHAGQRVLVFALPLEPWPAKFFRGEFMLPPEQEAEAMTALKAVEAKAASDTAQK